VQRHVDRESGTQSHIPSKAEGDSTGATLDVDDSIKLPAGLHIGGRSCLVL
jgi:hypothetical protein